MKGAQLACETGGKVEGLCMSFRLRLDVPRPADPACSRELSPPVLQVSPGSMRRVSCVVSSNWMEQSAKYFGT